MTRTDDSPHVPESRGPLSTSRSLLVRLKNNESEAWDRLVELYAPLVFYWCRRLDVSEQDVADIFQDVFQSVAKSIGGFRKERPSDTFRGWLRTITRNKVFDHYRRGGRQPEAAGGTEANIRLSQLPADEPQTDDNDDDTAKSLLFQRAMELIRRDFAEKTWQAFLGVVVDGKTSAEVAEELSMRPGTVRVAKSRVLHRLRRELGDLIE